MTTIETFSENDEHYRQFGETNGQICPSLVLADTILCDAVDKLYQPSDRQIRECCLNEYYMQCSLRRPL